MLDLLRSGPLPVAEVGEALGLGQPQTSKHLRALREAGLVVAIPDGQRRLYSVRPEPLRELADWLETYRNVLATNYDRLDTLLARFEDTE
jgi:DNA-binding transcriptional ArsR family regulator